MTFKSCSIASFVSAVAVGMVLAASQPAQDWPQWRGPNRDGLRSSFTEPQTWPEKLELQWEKSVGLGHSSPLIADGKIYLFTRQGKSEVVSCLEIATGRDLWQEAYPAPYRMNSAARSHGKGPKSTPVIDRGRLFTLGISGILSSFDAESGKLRWRKDFADTFGQTSPLYGAAMSMMVDGDYLIAHVGGQDDGALMAFHTDSGEVRWSWKGDGPGYAAPIIAELDGSRQIVTQAQEHLIGVSVENGKLLWSIPFSTAYTQNVPTPVVYRETLIFSGLDKPTFAIRPRRTDDGWTTETIWENRDVSMYMSSPVLIGEWLFGFSDRRRGQFFCLDAATGATRWISEGRAGANAAIIGAGEFLFLLTTNAELIVARATAESYDVVRNYTVAQSSTWAHPVILDHGVLIKDESKLALWKF